MDDENQKSPALLVQRSIDAPIPRVLIAVNTVYFTLFLAHSVWRTTFHNNAVSNFELTGGDVGLLFSISYIPGVFCFVLGFVATRVPLYHLLVAACALLAMGLLSTSVAAGMPGLALGTLLIAFGFTFSYTVANAACLVSSSSAAVETSLARLKSLGPLAGFTAALIILSLFAPGIFTQSLAVIVNENIGDIVPALFALFASSPEVDPNLLRRLLALLAVVLLLLGWVFARRLRVRGEDANYGVLKIRRKLLPYYCLNFLAGCRSAIFQSFALFVMVKQFDLPIHGTAALVLTGFLASFVGYRAVGTCLRYFSHRSVLIVMYLVVACNFCAFWYLVKWQNLTPDLALFGLGTLFVIDSAFFGVSVITDGHLRTTGEKADYLGDVATGTTAFSIAAITMSLVGATLWEPFGANAFLLGTLVCLMAAAVGKNLSGNSPQASL